MLFIFNLDVDYHTISEIKKAVDETISNLKVLKNSIDTEKKNLLDVRKKIFSSPPKKDSEGVLRNSNLEIIKDQRQKIIRINPQEKQNETEIILLKKRVQQLEKMLQSQVSRSVSSSPRRSSSNRYSSRLVSREGSPNNSDNLEKIRNRISDIDKKISSTKYNGKKLFSSNVLNQNKQRDIEQILEENRELKKELERKNNQIQSLIDLNLDLEDQLNDIKYQNEKEFSMVERVSLNLKENLSRILGENEVSGF